VADKPNEQGVALSELNKASWQPFPASIPSTNFQQNLKHKSTNFQQETDRDIRG
jgi:hypothetical protein